MTLRLIRQTGKDGCHLLANVGLATVNVTLFSAYVILVSCVFSKLALKILSTCILSNRNNLLSHIRMNVIYFVPY